MAKKSDQTPAEQSVASGAEDPEIRQSEEGGGRVGRRAVLAGGAIAALAAGAAHAAKTPAKRRELEGKVAIVTGARNNIGRGIARGLAEQGANVVIHYHRAATRAEAEQTKTLVEKQGVRGILVDGDLSQHANVKRLFDAAQKRFGRIDIVVNNAGAIVKKPLAQVTDAEFERLLGINTRGLFYMLREAARRIADGGRIINIGTSLLGATIGNYGAYTGTKAGAEQFTRALARELGPRGITVNVVAPGAVNTPFFHGQETPQIVEHVKQAHPAGRLAEVDDIVPMVVALASPRADWVSAQTIFVNNGFLAR